MPQQHSDDEDVELPVTDEQPVPDDLPPEPGVLTDSEHGIPGGQEELPAGDADTDEGSEL